MKRGEVDADGDGRGEPGWLGELAGGEPVRGTDQRHRYDPYIAAILGVKDGDGIAQKSGYLFRMFLLDAQGNWLAEPEHVDTAPPIDATQRWICYAWPALRGQSGNRAFVVTDEGRVYASPNDGPTPHDGFHRAPPWDAAMAPARDAVALAACGIRGRDGGQWVPAGN